MKKNRYIVKSNIGFGLIWLVLLIAALVSMLVAIGLGPVSISPATTAKVLLSKLPFASGFINSSWGPLEENIVLHLRLPRVCLGFIVGASLAVCGVAMQALVRNRLADPFILGVSSGAAAFATLSMLFGTFSFLGVHSLPLSAFIGSIISTSFVYFISRERRKINITQLLLSGVALSMIMDGITSVIKLGAPNALGLHNAEFWLSGSLAGAKWEYLTLPTAILLACVAFLLLNHRNMNLLLMGEDGAAALGLNVRSFQKMLIVVASLMTGVTIAVSGTIGFVGLMVPHFTRLLVGGEHKRVLPVSALLGGILVVWVDVAARLLIAPEELPVGILTAVIGGPVFIVLLKSKEKR